MPNELITVEQATKEMAQDLNDLAGRYGINPIDLLNVFAEAIGSPIRIVETDND